MRFTIKREYFLKALNDAGRAVSSRTASPILSNLKIDLTDTGLFITGSNEYFSIRSLVPYSKGDIEIIRNQQLGAILVNAQYFTNAVRKIESDEVTFDVVDSSLVKLNDSVTDYSFNCIQAVEYPDIDFDATGTELTLSKEVFSTIVSQTSFAASTKEDQPRLTALNMAAKAGQLTITATDRLRMARKTIEIDPSLEFNVNVPAKMMVEVDHLMEGNTDVNMVFTPQKALFTFDGTSVSTRLIPGEYPDTSNIVPRNANYSLQVNTSSFLKAIEKANVLNFEKENAILLKMSENSLQISAKSASAGSGNMIVETFKYEGEPLKIAANSLFIIEAAKSLNSENITIEFIGEMRPFVIKNFSDDSVVQVVTPLRNYNF